MFSLFYFVISIWFSVNNNVNLYRFSGCVRQLNEDYLLKRPLI
jgi:hypothetical protein